MRHSRMLHQVKVRHVVLSLLVTMFVVLILSHRNIEDPEDVKTLQGQGLTPMPEDNYKDAVRFSNLPDKKTLDKLKNLNGSYEMVKKPTKSRENQMESMNQIRQREEENFESDADGDLVEHKGLHENIILKQSIESSKRRSSNLDNKVDEGLQNSLFDPYVLFNEKMQAFLNKTDTVLQHDSFLGNNKRKLRHPNQTAIRNEPFKRMNKDLNDPSKTLNLRYITQNISHLVKYKKDEAIIWVTGHPRSGTTLMRAMLDAHSEIRCGEETHIIPRVLGTHSQLISDSGVHMDRLMEANIDSSVLVDALGAYVLTVIAKHGEPANRLCNKDPLTILNADVIRRILPNSKFLFMVRDGRAVVHSVVSRKVSIQGFDGSSYVKGLKSWNSMMMKMSKSCQKLGKVVKVPDLTYSDDYVHRQWKRHHWIESVRTTQAGEENVCLPVYYEQLVLHPRYQMKKILAFLDVPWDDIVLHHEETVGKKGGISLSMKEFSTDQVDKPVNMISLTSWVDHFSEETRKRVREVAPLIESFGYDVENYPPSYGEPDPEILDNTRAEEKRRQLKHLNNTEAALKQPKNKPETPLRDLFH